jgi:ketosteroid isomerase-like protein
MSQDNVEIVRRTYPAFNRRDIPAFLESLDPDVEWMPIMAALEGRVYRGHAGVRQWIEELAADWELFEVHTEDFRDLGDRVLVLGHWRARGRGSGVQLENQAAAWLSEVKGGKVVRMRTYSDRREALEAAGLSEKDTHADS